jgi:tetratricopeptide (TPR) repeat protein
MALSVHSDRRSPCLAEQTIIEFLTGRVSDQRLESIEAHLDACETCRRVVAVAHLSSRASAAALASTVGLSRALVGTSAAVVLSSLRTVHEEEYRIERELARGGMGRILLATDRQGRRVAVKVLLNPGEANTERFVREMQITARLQHPAIVTLHEAGRWPSGEPFFTMKLVEGSSLTEALEAASSLRARLELVPRLIAATDALAYAHHHGVIHRDLKPSNILLGAFGETVVIDWGLARVQRSRGAESGVSPTESNERTLDTPDDLTLAGTALGTPAYMPPEQARGLAVSERSDVYGLGAILYHLLSGGPPYVGTSARDVIERVLAGPPRPLESRVPAMPADLGAIVRKAMMSDPADRYPSAREMADDLRRFSAGQLVSAYAYPLGMLARRWLHKHRAVLGMTAALLVLGATLAVLSVVRIIHERQRAEEQRAVATTHRTAAEGLVSSLLQTFRDRVRLADRLDLFEGLGEDVASYYTTIDASGVELDQGSLANRAVVLETLGTAAKDQKNLAIARGLFERSLELWARATGEGAGSAQQVLGQAKVWQELATIEDAQGNLDASLAARQRAVELGERAAREDPASNEGTLLAVSNLEERAETLYYIKGDATAALESLAAARRLLEPALAASPGDSKLTWRLALLERLACDPELSLGRLDAAGAAIDRSVQLYAEVARQEPGNGVVAREHAYALGYVSTTAAAAGRITLALSSMRTHLQLYEEIAAADPNNRSTREDLGWGYALNCSLQRRVKRLPEAEVSCHRGLEIFREHVAHDRDSKTSRDALANALFEHGRLQLADGRLSASQRSLVESLGIYRGLVAADSSAGRWQEGLSLALIGLTATELALGRTREAALHADEATRIAERLGGDHPGANAESLLVRSRILVGDAARAEGRNAEALAAYRLAMELRESSVQRFPGFVEHLVDLAEASVKRARALEARGGDAGAARGWRERSLKILAELHEGGRLFPEDEPLREAVAREVDGLAREQD